MKARSTYPSCGSRTAASLRSRLTSRRHETRGIGRAASFRLAVALILVIGCFSLNPPASPAATAAVSEGMAPAVTSTLDPIPGAWQEQRISTPLEVMFLDTLHGWSRDATRRTTDGGQTWTLAHNPTVDVAAFVSPTEGWAAGHFWDEMCGYYIDHTTDGGATWSRQYQRWYGGGCSCTDLRFADPLHGWASCDPGSISTTDGGRTWERADALDTGAWLKMLDPTHWFKVTSDRYYPCTSNGIYELSETTDGGAAWRVVGRVPFWTALPVTDADSPPPPDAVTASGPYIAPDGNTVVVVGRAGHIARSTNKGATWTDAITPFTGDVSWVAFGDSARGWAAGPGGVLRTRDGGVTWTRQQVPTTKAVTQLIAFNASEALVSADRLYRTWDGGETWVPLPYAPEAPVSEFAASSSGVLWAAAGQLLSTVNGGLEWRTLDIPAIAVDAMGPRHVWALGGDTLWHSTDGGEQWTSQTVPTGGRDVDFVDATHGWLIGKDTVYHTADGGDSWQVQPAGIELPDVNYQQVVFTDELHGWVAGNVVLRTTDGGASWVRVASSNADPGCRLSFSGAEGRMLCTTLQHPGNGWTVYCTTMSHTSDGGSTWGGGWGEVCGILEAPLYLQNVSVLDANEVWAVGDKYWVRHTSDGGATWQETVHPSGLVLAGVLAVAPGVAFIGGESGLILRHDRTGLSSVTPPSTGNPPLAPVQAKAMAAPAEAALRDTQVDLAPAASRTWYVATDGDDGAGCTSANTACASIMAAMSQAADADTIRVGSGRYESDGLEVAFIYRDVTLSGGWAPGFITQNGYSVLDGEQARWGLTVKRGAHATVQRFVVQNGGPGGILNYGELRIEECSVQDNAGTGIWNRAGAMTVARSSVAGNTGGGIQNVAALSVENSTLSGNRSGWWHGKGSGAILSCGGAVSVSSSTITGNYSYCTGTVGQSYGTVAVRNTIIGGNFMTCSEEDCGYDWPRFRSEGHNLVGELGRDQCQFDAQPSDLVGVDARLGALSGSQEGPRYHPLLAGSPAIDAGNPAGCVDSAGAPLRSDQRGSPRPADGNGDGTAACDIGAYEILPKPLWLPMMMH